MVPYDDIPELIESIKIVVQRFDENKTQFSSGISGRREVINHIERLPDITLDAQVVFLDSKVKTEYSQAGVDEGISGYCVLRYVDLVNAGITLKRNDKIVKIGQLDVEYYITHTQGDAAAHFTSKNFTLVRVLFSDRVSSK